MVDAMTCGRVRMWTGVLAVLMGTLLLVGCAAADGREMVANGIGHTPEPTEAPVVEEPEPEPTSSLPEGTILESGGSANDGGFASGAAHGSVYVDSMAGTVGGAGSYDLSYPQLDGLKLDHPVNVALRRPTEAMRAEFVAAMSERSGEGSGEDSGEVIGGDSLRGSGKVYLLDDRLVSVVYEFRIEWSGAAGVDDRVDSVLVDLQMGDELGLEDLFVPGSPWLETVGFFARQDLVDGLGDMGLWPDGRGLESEASNYSVFGLTVAELVVRFGRYQVAPGAAGMPDATVRWASLAGLVDPDGPAGHLAASAG